MATAERYEARPLATVNICTRNRSESLRHTLASIAIAAKKVSDSWELHVIDNGSTDDTLATVEEFKGILPIRSLSAPTPGLSKARNVGVEHANGEFIIWTDDDVRVSEKWLSSYFEAFKSRPDCDLFGGKARPQYEQPAVKWFIGAEKHLEGLLAIRDQRSWVEIQSSNLPWGLNYAVRTSVQREHLYDPDLGVAPGRRRGGEETAMLSSALSSGAKGIWVWEAEVRHYIPKERQAIKYIWNYYSAVGEDWPIVPREGEKVWYPRWRLTIEMIRTSIKVAVLWVLRDVRWVGRLAFLAQTYGNFLTVTRDRNGRSEVP